MLALVAPFSTPALANDSEAEWAVGGLALKPNEAISMDREDLFISAEQVRVDYTYTNHSDTAQTVLVSFPLPALPGDEGWVEFGAYPDWGRLGFTTTVEGRPVEWTEAKRALAGGRDVTALVAAEGFPLEWYQDPDFVETVSKLSPDEVKWLSALGLLKRDPEAGGNDMLPAWTVRQSILREQVFPAHATVHVSHRYAPIAGGSVGGLLDRYGEAEYAEHTAHYVTKYCVDDAFIGGFRKRQQATKGDYGYGESWIGYVLSSGANWKGPIGEFRLVVDKGTPQNLVSFCMDGAKKISPTRFEVRKRNYEPQQDLNILIVHWFSDDE